MIYFCCDERRRNAVKEQSVLNGIDFLEVSDDATAPALERQRTLYVHFIHDLQPGALTTENVRVEGGERIGSIDVTAVESGGLSSPLGGSPPSSSPPSALIQPNVLAVRVSRPGDFSTYTLRLVADLQHPDPPDGFDPMLSAIDFSFKVACPSDFDCAHPVSCATGSGPQPDIDYLAKDYNSFRQLMLDRMALLMPQWRERNAADLGIALVELLAYVGDHLSYQQDAVATESYLGTARRRTSVRRHARLVDYVVHEGSNARAWVQVIAAPGVHHVSLKTAHEGQPTQLLTRSDGQPAVMSFASKSHERALSANPQVFELLHDIELFERHNEMRFYTWSARECCLPRGATRATLSGAYPDLKPGAVLIFVEVDNAGTGGRQDANSSQRHAVRLTKVTLTHDPLVVMASPPVSPPEASSPPGTGTPVTEIEWHEADALPFSLCISARRGSRYYQDVSVALGNIVLADHGMTVGDEPLEPVPDPMPALTKVSRKNDERCEEKAIVVTPPRFKPRLKRAPLTFATPYAANNAPASAMATMAWTTDTLAPAISLAAVERGPKMWEPKRDLLSSHRDARQFVVETETDGVAHLRFGNDQFGARPTARTQLFARYRIGNGVSGNVGADAIKHLVTSDPAITDQVVAGVRNPLAARGGTEPETLEHVRQNAPSAFRTQERAVTADDYAERARHCAADVQRAAATFRWTGSWRTVFLTVDRFGDRPVDVNFERDVRRCMERYRMAGHDLEVDGPLYVPLEIEMVACIKPGFLIADVKSALFEVFSNRTASDGRRGLFHPDSFTFGQTVFLSRFYAAAQAVAGVDSVEITRFQRQGSPTTEFLTTGRLTLGRLEIPRLDNDPNFPERGVFSLIVRGGR